MIERLKGLLARLESDEHGKPDGDDLALAAAALLVEAATMDGQFDDAERATIVRLMAARFALGAVAAAALVNEAEKTVAGSVEIFRFTNAVKDRFSQAQRIELMEMLWEVAYADGEVHHYEDNLLRRIAGLIYVTDRERGDARNRVRARLGLA